MNQAQVQLSQTTRDLFERTFAELRSKSVRSGQLQANLLTSLLDTMMSDRKPPRTSFKS